MWFYRLMVKEENKLILNETSHSLFAFAARLEGKHLSFCKAFTDFLFLHFKSLFFKNWYFVDFYSYSFFFRLLKNVEMEKNICFHFLHIFWGPHMLMTVFFQNILIIKFISCLFLSTYFYLSPNQNASSRHACHKFATSLRKLAAI